MKARHIALATVIIGTSFFTACGPGVESSSHDPKSPVSGVRSGDGELKLPEAIGRIPAAEEDRAGYERTSFRHWVNEAGNSCNTRQRVLVRDAVKPPEQGARCALTGGEWYSYYDGITVTDPGRLDIDHVVPLAEAWDSGASKWDSDRRMRYANDLDAPRSLLAVTDKSNRSKGDRDPHDWMPPAASAHCTYLADWTAVKLRWGLSADTKERSALTRLSANCKDTAVRYDVAP